MPVGVGTRIGPYEILGPLGEGGMGEVYRARDAKLNRDVAIKVLPELFSADPDRLARFRREAQVLASLNHQNIGHIYGLEEPSTGSGQAQVHALVLELVEGPTLADRIAEGPIPLDEAIPIARQIADALECAHEQGIIHRDLKPANIKLRPDGAVKVLDFGLAKALDPATTSSPDAMNSPTLTARGTQLGMIVGTAAYMAPEQARGRAVDRRADIWAFGVVLYEMLSGKRAFEGDDVSITLASVLKDDVDWKALPAGLPAPVIRVLRRCLDKDPKHRLSAIGDARLELEAAPQSAPEDLQRNTGDRSARPWRRLGYVATLLAAAAGGALAVAWQRPSPAGAPRIEFAITQPFQVNPFQLTLSPDGRAVAYLARESAAATAKIWVRSLDSQTARPIPGSDNAGNVFWSPDGQSLGYTVLNRLRVISLAGGSSLELCTLTGFAGATWNRDGTILVSDNRQLLRVPASGGAAVPVLKPEEASRDRPRLPSFLPDGKRFLYSMWAGPSTERRGVYLASLDDLPGRRLFEADAGAKYASGHLLYVKNGVLMAQPFDLASGSVTGEARRILSGILTAPAAGRAAFAAGEAETIAVRIGNDAEAAMRVKVFDRSGKPLQELGEPGAIRQIRLSPDGRRLAIERRDMRPVSDIFTMDVATGISTRLTFHEAGVLDPAWSPDSRRVAYGTRRDDKHVILAAAVGDTQGTALVTSAEPIKYLNDWSPDGRLVLFHDATGRTIFAADTAAGQTARILVGEGDSFDSVRISPDGRRVAFQSRDTSTTEVYVADFPSFARRTRVSAAGGAMPRWRGDGRELYYVSDARMLMAVPVGDMAENTFGVPRPLFAAPLPIPLFGGGLDLYDPSADGKRFYLISDDGDSRAEIPPITIVVNWLSALDKK